MKTISHSIIRQRGQITVPRRIRREVPWVAPEAVIRICVENPQTIMITPYSEQSSEISIKQLKKEMRKIRSFPGRRGNLSQFILRDRQTRQ